MAISSLISHSNSSDTSLYAYAALFISVLAIYNFDHLLDALMTSEDAKTFRHHFYQQHFILLIFWQLILLLVGVFIILYLPVKIFLAGVAMICLMVIYFWLIFKSLKNNLIYRELFVAFGYTLAVALAPVFSEKATINAHFFHMLVIVYLIVLTNLYVFSIYEMDIDMEENRHSIARSIKKPQMLNLSRALIMISFGVIAGYTLLYGVWMLGVTLVAVQLIYWLILEKQHVFAKNELYRLIGEFILILPGIALLAHAKL